MKKKNIWIKLILILGVSGLIILIIRIPLLSYQTIQRETRATLNDDFSLANIHLNPVPTHWLTIINTNAENEHQTINEAYITEHYWRYEQLQGVDWILTPYQQQQISDALLETRIRPENLLSFITNTQLFFNRTPTEPEIPYLFMIFFFRNVETDEYFRITVMGRDYITITNGLNWDGYNSSSFRIHAEDANFVDDILEIIGSDILNEMSKNCEFVNQGSWYEVECIRYADYPLPYG